MIRALFFIVALIFSVQTVGAQNETAIPETDRIRIAEAFRLRDKLADKVWSNWSETPFPLLLVTNEHEYLVRHPEPSRDFAPIGYDKLLKSQVYRRKRQYNPAFLATFQAVGGISTVVIGQAENTWVKTSTFWTTTVLHEHFHQFQDFQPGIYSEIAALDLTNGDTSGMWMLNYPFPYEDKKINDDFSAMAAQLARALEAADKTAFQTEFVNYLKMRRAFNSSLTEKDYRYLSFQLWKEGTSRYSEYKIAELAAKNYKPVKEFTRLKDYKTYREVADHWKKQTIESLGKIRLDKQRREIVYAYGAAEAMLLDKAGIEWKSRYFAEKFYLDKYFDRKN